MSIPVRCKVAKITLNVILLFTFFAPVQTQARAQPQTWIDPVRYCRAVGFVDEPLHDRRYRGSRVPPVALMAAQLEPSQRDMLVWRCMNGKGWACASLSSTACLKAPWLTPRSWSYVLRDANVRAECRKAISRECVGGTHCIVGCAGGQPHINGPSYPVDWRGYAPNDWTPFS